MNGEGKGGEDRTGETAFGDYQRKTSPQEEVDGLQECDPNRGAVSKNKEERRIDLRTIDAGIQRASGPFGLVAREKNEAE